MTTYRALERLAHPQAETVAEIVVPATASSSKTPRQADIATGSELNLGEVARLVRSASNCKLNEVWQKLNSDIASLSVRDVELQVITIA